MRRRDFLTSMGAAAGLALTGALPGRRALAADAGRRWGQYPDAALGTRVPDALQARNVLEVMLLGGISPWETFYAVDDPAYGAADGHMWFTFRDGPEGVLAAYEACGDAASGPVLQPFAEDSLGALVHLGPFVEPLRRRPDITDRMRIHVLSHTLFPHGPAQVLGMTGSNFASPRIAGVGSAVSHALLARIDAGLLPPAKTPLAHVINYGDISQVPFAHAAGQHPAVSRPFALDASIWSFSKAALSAMAGSVTGTPEAALLAHLRGDYQHRLRHPSLNGGAVRCAALDAFDHAQSTAERLVDLLGMLDDSLFVAPPGMACDTEFNVDVSALELRVAARLLRDPRSDARHITIADVGYIEPGPQPEQYDFHQRYVAQASRKLPYFFERLVSVINEPGEDDPDKIDLDETMVVLNTEFGRSPWTQDITGRNHHPDAYVTVMFGGPIGPAQRGIVGAIRPDGSAVDPFTPAATRAGVLAALGIWPFEDESYAFGDLRDVGDDLEASRRVTERLLGVTP